MEKWLQGTTKYMNLNSKDKITVKRNEMHIIIEPIQIKYENGEVI